ncbi:tyrosine-protein kinase STYK1-like isoform X2 [Antennarius striatus]|uniref:tyrosine-protein kinase STYK1-like isoform X2 n=1 Tax=Antennarius striatus TaxID=241820 RepID=UPI0035B49081
MTTNLTNADDLCALDDRLCIAREYEVAVIIIPTLFVLSTLVTMVTLCVLRYAPHRGLTRVFSSAHHSRKQRPSYRDHLQGVDAPPGIDPLEHEELPMAVQPVLRNAKPPPAAVPPTTTERQHSAFSQAPPPTVPPTTTERQHSAFSQATPLAPTFSMKSDDGVSLYRARMDRRGVVLRVLRETANSAEEQHFLGFASFLSGLGPHPFLPVLLGVASVRPPLMMVVEELQQRDLLGFLWRCRKDNPGSDPPCDLTEKRIFIMAGQVASALEYLHSQSCIHGNVGARCVLVGGDLTAKLWGLGSAYRRRAQRHPVAAADDMELRKWQAPEVLSKRAISQRSDVWSFGILLYEMITLGEPPFAQLLATEVLQYLQRGKHLQRPAACSNTLFSIIKFCCHWNAHQRPSTTDLIQKLRAAERSANGTTVLRVPEPVDIEKYLREAGYGEAYNYAVL